MDIETNGGPAFPSTFTFEPGSNSPDGQKLGPDEKQSYWIHGMSLRDWFAGRMLPRLASTKLNSGEYMSPAAAANTAYEYADAMLEARKNTTVR